jgi:glycine/D-amino acid oxidase-like deaminating enzyme
MDELEKTYREDGAKVRKTSAERLVVENDLVTRVELSQGEPIDTTNTEVLVATGSWTIPLLKKSRITLPQVARCPMSTGVFTIHVKLNREQMEATKDIPPISVYGMDTPHADGGEYFPPDKQGVAKIGWTMPYRNENPVDVSNSKLALRALAGARCFIEIFVPQLRGAKIVKICSLW